MTIGGVNAIVAVGVLAAIGDIARFSSPEKLLSYFDLNPRVRQSGDRVGPAPEWEGASGASALRRSR
jgi:transposase